MPRTNGYIVVAPPDGYAGATQCGGRYVYEHHLAVEQGLGRLLGPDELVHHCNGGRGDNRPENLKLTGRGDHTALHHAGAKRTALTRARMRAAWERRRRRTFTTE